MDETKLVSQTWVNSGVTMLFTWYPGDDIKLYEPFNQVYGVVFGLDGRMLIQRREARPWCLAGGTVEEGESAEQTLRRELIEEADVTIKNPILLGGQRVQFPGGHNPNPTKRFVGDDFYQLRYYCEIDEVLPQTPDPDHGIINERLFVSPTEINNYLDWGATGQAIFKQAIELYKKLHYHEDEERRIQGERHAGFVIKDAKILIIHRIKQGHEYYVFPGGHRRKDETGPETVVREIFEETGITSKVTSTAFIRINDDLKHIDHYYLCKWLSGDKPELMGEEKVKHSLENFYEPLWVNLADLHTLNVLPIYAKSWILENT